MVPPDGGFVKHQVQKLDSLTSSQTTMDQIRSWTNESSTPHQQSIMLPQREHSLPTRLIDVCATSNTSAIKLVESIYIEAGSSYCSLSHCWGKADFLCLTTNNSLQLHNEILLSELPRTFHDAIMVARSTGVRYIWIDSLCIIQDSKDDWQNESISMRKVYQGAKFNIAATQASDNCVGLFCLRPPRRMPSFSIYKKWCAGGSKSGMFKWGNTVDNEDKRHQGIEFATLNSRAWVFQERFLSPRTIHFTQYGVYFECNATLYSESEPYEPMDKNLSSDISAKQCFLQPGLSSRAASENEDVVIQTLHSSWEKIVECYSRKFISYGTDRLIAISSIAQEFSATYSDAYCAGHWQSSLPFSLRWTFPSRYLGITVRQVPILDEFTAPSWSWATVNRLIEFADHNEGRSKPLAEFVRCEIKTVNDNIWGQVESGRLEINGCLIRVKHFASNERDSSWSFDINAHGREHYSDISTYSTWLLQGDEWHYGRLLLDNPCWSRSAADEFSNLTFLWLPVSIEETGPDQRSNNTPANIWGLALKKQRECYIRIGLFTIYFKDNATANKTASSLLQNIAVIPIL